VGSDLVGYEFDGLVDNGFPPTGQIAASTTIAAVPEILQDFGLRPPPALTHHFSEYSAPRRHTRGSVPSRRCQDLSGIRAASSVPATRCQEISGI